MLKEDSRAGVSAKYLRKLVIQHRDMMNGFVKENNFIVTDASTTQLLRAFEAGADVYNEERRKHDLALGSREIQRVDERFRLVLFRILKVMDTHTAEIEAACVQGVDATASLLALNLFVNWTAAAPWHGAETVVGTRFFHIKPKDKDGELTAHRWLCACTNRADVQKALTLIRARKCLAGFETTVAYSHKTLAKIMQGLDESP